MGVALLESDGAKSVWGGILSKGTRFGFILLFVILPSLIAFLLYHRPWLPEIYKHEWPKVIPLDYQTVGLKEFYRNPPEGFLDDPCTATIHLKIDFPIVSEEPQRLRLDGLTTYGTWFFESYSLDPKQLEYQIGPLLGGTYRLRFPLPRLPSVNFHLAPGEQKELDLSLGDLFLPLQVRVMGHDGQPAQHGWVRLLECPDGTSEHHCQYLYQAFVGKDGIARFELVMPDRYRVSAWCGSSGLVIQDRVDLRGQAEETEIELQLDAGVSLHGRIVDSNGTGIANALVFVSQSYDSAFPQMGRLNSETDLVDSGHIGKVWTLSGSDGSFTLHGLDNRSRYQISVMVDGKKYDDSPIVHPSAKNLVIVASSLVSLRPPKAMPRPTPAPLDLTYHDASLTLFVRDEDENPITNALVYQSHFGFCRTGPDGEVKLDITEDEFRNHGANLFLFRVFSPGYTKILDDDDVDELRRSYFKTAKLPNEAKMIQKIMPVLAGQVTGSDGKPLEKTRLSVLFADSYKDFHPNTTQLYYAVRTLSDGKFVMEMERGAKSLYIIAEKDGFARRWFGPIEVYEGQAVYGLHLEMEKNAPYVFVCKDLFELPIVGASIICESGAQTPEGELMFQRAYAASDWYGNLIVEDAAPGEIVHRVPDARSAGSDPIVLPESTGEPILLPQGKPYPEITLHVFDAQGQPLVDVPCIVMSDPVDWGRLEIARRYLLGPKPLLVVPNGGTTRSQTDQQGIARFWFNPSARIKLRVPGAGPDIGGVDAGKIGDGTYTLGELHMKANGEAVLE